jgi:glycosyltransferase involved in cell wall biosynthesis
MLRGAGTLATAVLRGVPAAIRVPRTFLAGLLVLAGRSVKISAAAAHRGFRAYTLAGLRVRDQFDARVRRWSAPIIDAAQVPLVALRWINRAPRRASHKRARRRIGRITRDPGLLAAPTSSIPISPAVKDRIAAVLWTAAYVPLIITALTAGFLKALGLAFRAIGWSFRTVLSLAVLPIPTIRTLITGVRPGVYSCLRRVLMFAHKPLLLHDYTVRSNDHVRRRLDPNEAWNPAAHQIFHAHDLNTLVSAYLLARTTKSPLVYDSHELHLQASRATEAGPLTRAFLRRYEGFLIRRSEATITVCDSLATIIAAEHRVPTPTVVRNTPDLVSNPPRLARRLREALAIPDHLRIALYHGNVTAYRGLEVMLEALPLMSDVAVVFLGTGALRMDLEEMAQRLGVYGRTAFFHDPVSGDVLNEYVASADVGVVPLEVEVLSYYFSLPNKLFELTMAARPIVAANLPEIRRVIQTYGVGRLFAPGDARQLAEAVMATLDMSTTALEDYRARAQVAARENCWEIEREKLVRLYRDIQPGVRRPSRDEARVAA